MSDWPPAADPSTEWTSVRPLNGEATPVRPVKLWGKVVLVNAEHLVWCEDCLQFIAVAELGRPDNSHRPGLVVRSGSVIPMGAEEPERLQTLWDKQW